MSASDTIEIIRRIIADDTADLRERVQHLEQRSNGVSAVTDSGEHVDIGNVADDQATINPELQERLDQIKAFHQLDATPVQYTRDPKSGKMVEAPEGLWEITCLACKHHTYYQEGKQTQPPQCETWQLANGTASKRP